MVEYQVYHEDKKIAGEARWVAWNNVSEHYIGTYDTQKEAIKAAKGKAQGYADRHDVQARVEVYQRNGSHKKTLRIDSKNSLLS